MTHVTCRLTAKNRGQLRNPTLGNRVWTTFYLYLPYGQAPVRFVNWNYDVYVMFWRPTSHNLCPFSIANLKPNREEWQSRELTAEFNHENLLASPREICSFDRSIRTNWCMASEARAWSLLTLLRAALLSGRKWRWCRRRVNIADDQRFSGRCVAAGSTSASHVTNRKCAPSTRSTGTSVAPADCRSASTSAWTRKVNVDVSVSSSFI